MNNPLKKLGHPTSLGMSYGEVLFWSLLFCAVFSLGVWLGVA